ncbi:MAG: uracil-DNA glycosylase family protein [Thermoleophilia bacterium]
MTHTSPNDDVRERAAEELRAQAADLSECRRCRLSEGRTQVVFGVGSASADLMFVGEGPGFHEDQQGEPFVGRAGTLLTELLASIGLRREDVYIANVVKCRPPENRDPLPDEIEACSPNLVRQIQTIRPRVICTLGRFATRLVAETDAGISSIRGRAKQMQVAGVPVVVLPVFHPAAALYTPANRSTLEEDFLKLRRLLEAGEKALVPGAPAVAVAAADDAGETQAAPAKGPEADGADAPVPPTDGPARDGSSAQLHLW